MKQVIHAGSAPEEMPFVPGMSVQGGRTVYLSGATAFPLYHKHPHDEEELRPPESIGAQTQVALNNLRLVLEAAGGRLTDIVKVTIFNTEMEHQDEVNRVYQKFFGGHRPARSHVGVSRLVGRGLKIEIEAVAVIDD